MTHLTAGSNDVNYAFLKIYIAIELPNSRNFQAAIDVGLNVLSQELDLFRQVLRRVVQKADLDAYEHGITMLRGYFSGNPDIFPERAARMCSKYLKSEHSAFVRLASRAEGLTFRL